MDQTPNTYILAIDQGTSSTKAIIFDNKGKVIKKASAPLPTNYRLDGFVEQNPQDILTSVEDACRACLTDFDTQNLSTIGISNQRETFVLWDNDGKPVYPAIVWACKRSVELCGKIQDQSDWLNEKTGLVVDPYFSGTKLLWLLENEPLISERIKNGELFFGTVDTWLLYHLTNGTSYYTDHSNASRTLFFNLNDLAWDEDILQKWGLNNLQLPEIKPSSDHFGETSLFGLLDNKVAISAMIGDSHAAMFGEACFQKGSTKMTLGTGSSLLMHIGQMPRKSAQGLLSTIGWSTKNEVAYAWEGAIVACGSMIEWLKSMNILTSAEASADIAESVLDTSEVYLVPAFSGLGAPFWQMDRKASFHGLTFGTTKGHLVRATLESICFQIKAVIDAMEQDLQQPMAQTAMHGGLSKNAFVQKGLASLLEAVIKVQDNADISAQGAAFLAGLSMGVFKDLDHISSLISSNTLEKKQKSNWEPKYQYWSNLIIQKTNQ